MKKYLSVLLALSLCVLLSACKGDTAVFVQSVAELSGFGGIAAGNRFSAMVVSEHTTEVKKDGDKAVEEIFVKEGDDVKVGQPLFTYDMDELQLGFDKLQLERDQLTASIESYKTQIAQLERDRNNSWGNNKLQITIQIQTTQVDLKEAELTLKAKENEVSRAQALLENSTVTAPTAGRIQSINESGTDANGNTLPFIVIQEAGAYRVKGVINELQRGSIYDGQRIKMTSRVDASAVWYGKVTLVDYENPISNNGNMYGMPSDEMTSSSKYPFYVALDSTEGLMMGQHLYLEPDTGESGSGITLDASFVVVNDNGSAFVWAEKRGKLEKRTVTLSPLNEGDNTYQILSGLSVDDFIAFPDANCRAGCPTTRVQEFTPEEPDGEFFEYFDEPMDFDMPMDIPEDEGVTDEAEQIPEDVQDETEQTPEDMQEETTKPGEEE